MKEHKIVAGGRKWFGTDFVELQAEALKAAQGIVADLGPCVLSGCKVTIDNFGGMTISPGFVAITSAGTVRIAYFAGIPPQQSNVHPRYMFIQATDSSRLYDDGVSRIVSTNYTAVLQDSLVIGQEYLFFSDTGARSMAEALGLQGVGAVVAYAGTHSGGSTSVSLSFRPNLLTRRVDVWGTVTVANAQALSVPAIFYAMGLPIPIAVARPLVSVYLPLTIRHHSSAGLSSPELRAMPLELRADGSISLGIIRPADSSITTYTGNVSGSYPI